MLFRFVSAKSWVLFVLVGETPGTSSARSRKLRPFIGRFCTSACGMVPAIWLRAASIAGAAGVPISSHLYPEVAAHVMRVTETAHWLEWQDWADPILQRPFVIKDGHLHIPDVPGIGIEWNEDAVKANAANL